jgi:hypothetical protein
LTAVDDPPSVLLAPSTERLRLMALRQAVASAAVSRKAGQGRHRLGAFLVGPSQLGAELLASRLPATVLVAHARSAGSVPRGDRRRFVGEEDAVAHVEAPGDEAQRDRAVEPAVDPRPTVPAQSAGRRREELQPVGTDQAVGPCEGHTSENLDHTRPREMLTSALFAISAEFRRSDS